MVFPRRLTKTCSKILAKIITKICNKSLSKTFTNNLAKILIQTSFTNIYQDYNQDALRLPSKLAKSLVPGTPHISWEKFTNLIVISISESVPQSSHSVFWRHLDRNRRQLLALSRNHQHENRIRIFRIWSKDVTFLFPTYHWELRFTKSSSKNLLLDRTEIIQN